MTNKPNQTAFTGFFKGTALVGLLTFSLFAGDVSASLTVEEDVEHEETFSRVQAEESFTFIIRSLLSAEGKKEHEINDIKRKAGIVEGYLKALRLTKEDLEAQAIETGAANQRIVLELSEIKKEMSRLELAAQDTVLEFEPKLKSSPLSDGSVQSENEPLLGGVPSKVKAHWPGRLMAFIGGAAITGGAWVLVWYLALN